MFARIWLHERLGLGRQFSGGGTCWTRTLKLNWTDLAIPRQYPYIQVSRFDLVFYLGMDFAAWVASQKLCKIAKTPSFTLSLAHNRNDARQETRIYVSQYSFQVSWEGQKIRWKYSQRQQYPIGWVECSHCICSVQGMANPETIFDELDFCKDGAVTQVPD